MAKTKTTQRAKKSPRRRTVRQASRELLFESDGTYLLKLVTVVILGAMWLRFREPIVGGGLAIKGFPVGLFAGILGVKIFEKHQSDRKIWYVVLIVVGIVSAWLPIGIFF